MSKTPRESEEKTEADCTLELDGETTKLHGVSLAGYIRLPTVRRALFINAVNLIDREWPIVAP